MKIINIYTDGSAKGNPGPGGYGIVLSHNKIKKELSEGFKLTTNNRMELLAVIIGLESIKETGYRIISNSGVDGGQEVPHFHIHILGGEKIGAKIR